MTNDLDKFHNLMKSIYKGHRGEFENVPLMSSCPLYTGLNYMNYSLNGENDTALYRGGLAIYRSIKVDLTVLACNLFISASIHDILYSTISFTAVRSSLKITKNKTKYDYNLMIMKSPKPATDNRFK